MKLLLLVSPVAEANGALTYAIEQAQQRRSELLIAVVMDVDLSQRVDAALANTGFVGEKLGATVVEALKREQRTLAEEREREFVAAATQAGLTATSIVEEGDPEAICARLIQAHHISFAVLAVEKRSWLTRLLSRTPPVKSPTLSGCEIKVIDH